MQIFKLILIIVGGFAVVRSLIELYHIAVLKSIYKQTDKHFVYCFKSVTFFSSLSLIYMTVGILLINYAFIREDVEVEIFGLPYSIVYFSMLITMSLMRSFEKKLSTKYLIPH